MDAYRNLPVKAILISDPGQFVKWQVIKKCLWEKISEGS